MFIEFITLFEVNKLESIEKKIEKIEFLLKKGANPNIPDSSDMTPLHVILRNYQNYFE